MKIGKFNAAKAILTSVGVFSLATTFGIYKGSFFIYVPEAGAPQNTTQCTLQKFGLTTMNPTTTIWGTTNFLLPCTSLAVRVAP